MDAKNTEPGLEIPLGGDPAVVLFAERLRDGRIAIGTRTQAADGGWRSGELHLLEPGAYLALAAWLSPAVEDAWIGTVRSRAEDSLRTAWDLYDGGAEAAERLAGEILNEISPSLVARALLLLLNSIGPDARERLVERLNRTDSSAEDAVLRRRLATESEAFAYAVAAASLFDAVARGAADEPAGNDAPPQHDG